MSGGLSQPPFTVQPVGPKPFREKRHEDKLKESFRGQVDFLGTLPEADAQSFASGQTVLLPGGVTASKMSPAGVQCCVCSRMHGASRDKKEWNPTALSRTSFYRTASGVVALSDSCRKKYLEPVKAALLTNLSAYDQYYHGVSLGKPAQCDRDQVPIIRTLTKWLVANRWSSSLQIRCDQLPQGESLCEDPSVACVE